MTVGQDNAIATPAAGAEPKPNSFQRIIGVLFSPDATFASIARRPDWVVPLLLILVIALGNGILIASRIDFGAPAREAMAQNKNMTQEQMERAEKMSVGIGKVAKFIAPVFTALAMIVIAGALLVAVRVMGGEGDFKQAFSVTCYAWIPNVLQSILLTIIVFAKGATAINPTTFPTMLRSNLAFLVDMKTQPMAFASSLAMVDRTSATTARASRQATPAVRSGVLPAVPLGLAAADAQPATSAAAATIETLCRSA